MRHTINNMVTLRDFAWLILLAAVGEKHMDEHRGIGVSYFPMKPHDQIRWITETLVVSVFHLSVQNFKMSETMKYNGWFRDVRCSMQYHLASWKFMRCLQCFLEYEFVLFQIITKKHIHLKQDHRFRYSKDGTLFTTGWEHGAFFPHFYIANFGGRCIHFQHPNVPIHRAVLWKSSTPRNTAEDFADLFPKLTADEILIGLVRWAAGLNYSKEHVQCSLYHLISQYYIYICIYIIVYIYIRL